ncbi:MKK1 [Symbiodinium natans]|uniref:MKK1 protein n=1 Tax=Symbiodinium natans TaxID=878477 RepID=A0A812RLM0_9DINO|nr:MKK1 [Symbiodinium natans]
MGSSTTSWYPRVQSQAWNLSSVLRAQGGGSFFKVNLPANDSADVEVPIPEGKKTVTIKVRGKDYQITSGDPSAGDSVTVSVAEASDPSVKEGRRLLYAGCESLTTLFNVTPKEDGSPLEFYQTLQNKAKVEQLRLFRPGASPQAKTEDKDKVKEKALEEEVAADLDITCSHVKEQKSVPIGDAQQLMPCVSPELVGGGVNTTLYSCNRAAWFDPGLGAGKFRPDHVANYVELKLSSLTFPISDKWTDAEEKSSYYVRANICGVTVTSSALHRSNPSWSKVLPSHLVDPGQIRFEGQQLLIPLPAGCWASNDEQRKQMRKVQLEVVKVSSKDGGSSMDFDSFASTAGTAKNTYTETVKFKAALTFDNHMLVDMQKQLGLFLTQPDQPVREVDVFRPAAKDDSATGSTAPQGMLSLEFALRDRDQARAVMGQPGHRSALCIGDKAMLVVEEPFQYPKDPSDFRKQFCVGDFAKNKKEWPAPGVPLREPCLSSEYAESGLGDLVPKRPFKQSFIPTFCDDIIPHKYVMPLTEKEFLDKHKPGYFGRIMDDMAKRSGSDLRDQLPYRSGPNKPIVSHLTHMNRHVPVTVLAMYADNGNGTTCDVEVTELFVKKWQEQKHRKFAFPGKLEKSAGKAKEGETATPRFILRQVPTILLSAVHYSGVNVYDALYKTTSDVINAPPAVNEFDPRSYEAAQKGAKKDYLEYKLAAGPLPPDASTSACLYEFNVRVRFPSEYEMYQFVAMVRKCVRVDHYQQALKMMEYQKQTQISTPMQIRHPGLHKTGGQLDVLLVEARRLQPLQSALNTVLTSDPITLYESWSKGRSDVDPSQSNQMVDANYLPELLGTTDGQAVKGTPEGSSIGTFVNFRMLHNKEVIPFRGKNKQVSPVISGTDSPCWSKLPELEGVGGWTFRTGMIDPEKYPKLLIEFEVMKAGMSPSRIGVIQLPVTEEQFLTNPNQMFKNLWLPLVSVKDGELTPNITGEIHVLTRWLPSEMKQVFADGQEKMQLSVRSMFLKEIWSKVCQPRVREPIYGVEAMYHSFTYNPNVVRLKDKEGTKTPETQKDNMRRHVEELSNAVPYLECLERRQLNAWNIFQAELQDRGYEGRSIGELRLLWQQNEDQTMLNKLQQLVLRGVPSALRPQVWAELTLASRVATQDGAAFGRDPEASGEEAAEQEYRELLERGLPQHSDAMQQLQEDAVLLAGWESSTPPLPEAMELHLKRIKNAKNVVTALLAIEDSGITYCESLLAP